MSQPRPSSVVVPIAPRGDQTLIFWARRRHDARFLGGFFAFIGGSIDPEDATQNLSSVDSLPPEFTAAHIACAARELFEETGILVGSEGLFLSDQEPLRSLRRELLAGSISFARIVEQFGPIPTHRFIPIGHWVTPEAYELRFDSCFFAIEFTDAELERVQRYQPELQETELEVAEWIRPADALDRFYKGSRVMNLPVRRVLEALTTTRAQGIFVREDTEESALDAARIMHGLSVIPVRTATLPPATHTNTFFVGEDDFVIVDPGAHGEVELDRLRDVLREAIALGRHPRAIIATHHHPDHIGGIDPLAREFSLEVWAHPRCAERCATRLQTPISRLLRHGDRITLGSTALETLHTPGHADGHLAFIHEATEVVLAADLVASQGTILVDPDDGHMGDYLDSLRRVHALEPRALLPSHGGVVSNARALLEHYIDHRLAREEKVYRALVEAGESRPMDLVPIAYEDTPKPLWPLAARSTEAHLIHLVELGRATSARGRYSAQH